MEQKVSIDFDSFKHECSAAISPFLTTSPILCQAFDNLPLCDEKILQLYNRENITLSIDHSMKAFDKRIIPKLITPNLKYKFDFES